MLPDTWELLLVQSHGHSKSRLQVLVDLHLLGRGQKKRVVSPNDQQGSLLPVTLESGGCRPGLSKQGHWGSPLTEDHFHQTLMTAGYNGAHLAHGRLRQKEFHEFEASQGLTLI